MAEISITQYEGAPAGTKILGLVGEMDEPSLQDIKLNVDPILGEATIKFLALDLKDLSYINSKGIGYLVALHTHLSKEGRRLILCSAQEAVMDVMNLVGLTTIIPHRDTLEEALGIATA